MVEAKQEVKEFKVPSHWVAVDKLTPELISQYGRHAFNISVDGKVYRSDYEHPEYQAWLKKKQQEKSDNMAKKEALREARRKSVENRIQEAFESGERSGRLSAKREFEVKLATMKEEMRHHTRMEKIKSRSKKGSVSVTETPVVADTKPNTGSTQPVPVPSK